MSKLLVLALAIGLFASHAAPLASDPPSVQAHSQRGSDKAKTELSVQGKVGKKATRAERRARRRAERAKRKGSELGIDEGNVDFGDDDDDADDDSIDGNADVHASSRGGNSACGCLPASPRMLDDDAASWSAQQASNARCTARLSENRRQASLREKMAKNAVTIQDKGSFWDLRRHAARSLARGTITLLKPPYLSHCFELMRTLLILGRACCASLSCMRTLILVNIIACYYDKSCIAPPPSFIMHRHLPTTTGTSIRRAAVHTTPGSSARHFCMTKRPALRSLRTSTPCSSHCSAQAWRL